MAIFRERLNGVKLLIGNNWEFDFISHLINWYWEYLEE